MRFRLIFNNNYIITIKFFNCQVLTGYHNPLPFFIPHQSIAP